MVSLIDKVILQASALEGAVTPSRTSPLNHLIRGQDCHLAVEFVWACLKPAAVSMFGALDLSFNLNHI